MEEFGQSAADAGDRTVRARAEQFTGFRFGLFLLRGAAAAFAEVGGRSHAVHGLADRVEGDDPHRRRNDLAENLSDARFDVAHGLGIVFGQAAADIFEIVSQYAVGVFVEREGLRTDVYVYCLFHSRRS